MRRDTVGGKRSDASARPGPPRPRRPPIASVLGTAVFVLLVPMSVVGLVPWWITRWRVGPPLLGIGALRWVGTALLVAGVPLFVDFVVRFVVEGHGTPAPVAPTRFLVKGGPFRWVRNPGYLAVIALVTGQGLLFGSAGVLVMAAGLGLGFHLFVVFYEEPTLHRAFGAEYEAYRRRVPRWLPRRPRA